MPQQFYMNWGICPLCPSVHTSDKYSINSRPRKRLFAYAVYFTAVWNMNCYYTITIYNPIKTILCNIGCQLENIRYRILKTLL